MRFLAYLPFVLLSGVAVAQNADEFKLKAQGIQSTSDIAKDLMEQSMAGSSSMGDAPSDPGISSSFSGAGGSSDDNLFDFSNQLED